MDYKIVVPSRMRTDNMARIESLLPSSVVCVDEREREEYEAVVSKDRLWLHPPTKSLAEVRQWIVDNNDREVTLMIDDDFQGVRIRIGAHHKTTVIPAAIRQIIENGVQIATDLRIPLFGWGCNPNPKRVLPFKPIALVSPVACAIGIIGKDVHYDMDSIARDDVSLALGVLLKSRIVFVDERFFFSFGAIWSGRGGLRGHQTGAGVLEEEKRLKRRWGKYVNFRSASRKGKSKAGMSFAGIKRQQPYATR